MFPINVYSNELFYRICYVFISLVFAVLIIVNKFEVIILIETIPFIYSGKKFTVVEITDLIELLWFLIFSVSFLTLWPFIIFHLNQFFKPSWYLYQIHYIKSIFKQFFFISVFSWTLTYFEILPNILQLLIELKPTSSNQLGALLTLDIQLNLLKYIVWVAEFQYLANFVMLNIAFCLIFSKFFWTLSLKYYLITNYRKIILFCVTFVLYIMLPSYIIFQVLIFILSFLLFESLYFFLCLRVTNQIIEQTYAYFKTTTKKNSR
uniref:SecY-independent transporter protein n=1 Tax=Gelidium galapagense TaxID=317100 RepID=A0A1D8X7F0_9FLOR|nr:SecY-independent transporter protein [Gelidium galapagense]AOX48958.1 SecY-independent transporter protein [Gelidium galapagense]